MTTRILHLSDLHFGSWRFAEIEKGETGEQIVRTARSTHAFIDGDGRSDPSWLVELLERDEQLRQRKPDAIVVSGDIGWSGDADDYKLATDFFQRLTLLWSDTALVLAPGNHDMSWSASERGEDAQSGFRDLIRSVARDRLSDWLFADQEFSEDRNRIASIHSVGTATFVTVNSAASLTHDPKKSPVCVHPKTLIEIERRLQTDRSALRVFVVHHHLLPFYDDHAAARFEPGRAVAADRTIVANSAQVQEWLARNGFDLVLHGHKHVPHARRDVLVTGTNAYERDVVIVGAGSAGVHRGELPAGEHHSFNIVTVSPGARRKWRMRVDVRNVARGIVPPAPGFSFDREVGFRASSLPEVFGANDWKACHAALTERCWPNGIPSSEPECKAPTLTNFVSVVEFAPIVFGETFDVPETVRNRDCVPQTAEFIRAFNTLYPEYSETNGWRDRTKLGQILQNRSSRFHFHHGSRLFAPDRATGIVGSPLLRAIDQISPGSTRAYASTFRPDVGSSKTEPMPALVGVQFLVEDSRFLDAVATFRNLELSFWWTLNMIEVSRLLHFAAEQAGSTYVPRRITFVSPIADWRWRPNPPVVSRLDDANLGDLTLCVQQTYSGRAGAGNPLLDMIEEKAATTSEFTLVDSRVNDLADLLAALDPSPQSAEAKELVSCLRKAAFALRDGVARSDERKHFAVVAQQELTKAAGALKRRLGSPIV